MVRGRSASSEVTLILKEVNMETGHENFWKELLTFIHESDDQILEQQHFWYIYFDSPKEGLKIFSWNGGGDKAPWVIHIGQPFNLAFFSFKKLNMGSDMN